MEINFVCSAGIDEEKFCLKKIKIEDLMLKNEIIKNFDTGIKVEVINWFGGNQKE